MNTKKTQKSKNPILTHTDIPESLEKNIDFLSKKVRERGELPYATVTEQLQILNELSESPLGRFLIQQRGLNGYWTNVALMHPERRYTTKLSRMEDFLLNRSPTVLATQERFKIFKQETQKRLHDGMTLASIPCGLMSDLLTIDYSKVQDITLYGVDIDHDSLKEAEKQAKNFNCPANLELFQMDAWTFQLPNPVDLLTSNGLNIYEPDDSRVIALYRHFYENLKPGGIFITSFLTPPPTLGSPSEWKPGTFNPEDGRIQRVIFADIIGANWQVFRTTEETKRQLKSAGFEIIDISTGSSGIFPTVVAYRPKIG